ncbi:hypothetical protein Tco_0694070 [Tanacetum coccineum]
MTTIPLPPQPQQGSSDSILINRLGKLEQHISDLVDANQALEERCRIYGSRLLRLENQDSPNQLEAVVEIVNRMLGPLELQDAYGVLGRLFPPPPPSPSNNQGGQSTSTAAPSSSKTAASAEYTAWMMTDTRLKPSVSPIPEELHMDDDTTAGVTRYSYSGLCPEVTYNSPENSLLAQMMIWTHSWTVPMEDATTFSSIKWDDASLGQCQQTTTAGWPALSISKMKVAYYPNVSLGQMVLDQMWIEEECKYDIAAMAVWTHMRILSVVRIEVFPMYGYNYMKKIVLRRADLKEYVIAERDFKYLYPSDFEDLYLLNLQGHLNHLSPEDKKILTTAVNLWTRNLVIRQRVEDFQLGIESYQTQLNLTKPRWDAKGFEYKHDFIVIDSPRAVTFRDKYGVQMIMRFNEIHKFSDGTLQ